MKNLIRIASLLILSLVLANCGSRPVVPDVEEVKVSREPAPKKCQEIGKISGYVISKKGTAEEALKDLKNTATHKGANYVVVEQYSEQGTSVTGIAYKCP